MAGQEERRALRDYAIPSLIGATSCIKMTTIQANNFEVKIGLIRRCKMIVNLEAFPMMIRMSIL